MRRIRKISRLTVLLAVLAASGGCVFQGMFAGRNAFEFYQGQAVGPEIHEVAGGYALKASLHTHTNLSHGALSMEEVARIARSHGVAVLGITEHDSLEACWGRVVCFRDPSVIEMGYAQYLEQIQKVGQANPDLLILPGLEVAPYSWWTGVPPWLRLHGWDTHFTVYNLKDAETCAGLPTLANHNLQPAHPRRNRGEKPYQQLITDVADHSGLVFLAHPESQSSHRFATAKTMTPPYPDYARDLVGLTGFAALPAGREKLLQSGGIWDQTLLEYLAGRRERPIWVVGDVDFHGDDQQIDRVLTWIYAEGRDEAEVLKAMGRGRMVAAQGDDLAGVWVTEFALVRAGEKPARVMLGEVSPDPLAREIRFALSRGAEGLSVRLIRNGEVIYTTAEAGFRVDDSAFLDRGAPAAYRVEVKGRGDSLLVTNPIFIFGTGIRGRSGPQIN